MATTAVTEAVEEKIRLRKEVKRSEKGELLIMNVVKEDVYEKNGLEYTFESDYCSGKRHCGCDWRTSNDIVG